MIKPWNYIAKNKGKLVLIIGILVIGGFIITRITTIRQPKGSRPLTLKIDLSKSQTFQVNRTTLIDTLSLAGKVQADKIANVQFQASGKLIWVGFKEGDYIKKGQAIASLDKQILKKQFEKEANDYLTSRWNFEDTQDTYKTTKEKSLLTDEIRRILDRQQYTLNNAVLDYELADLAVKYATIYSPFDGLLVSANPKYPNLNITAINSGYTIVDPQSVYFRSEIDEEDVNKIKLSQSAGLTIDSYPTETIDSQVDFIAFVPVEGQTSTVYEVKFFLPQNNQLLKYRLGMNGEAVITTASVSGVLAVPSDAVFSEKQNNYVYRFNAITKQFEKVMVELGLFTDEKTEIKSGLSENDTILVTLPK